MAAAPAEITKKTGDLSHSLPSPKIISRLAIFYVLSPRELA
jgi:hypothetical protein